MTNAVAAPTNIVNTDTGALVLEPTSMHNIIQFAEFMAGAGPMLPDHLKGKPADCMAITLQAMQWGMSPFAVAQKTHLVNGTLGYEAQLVNAVVSSSRAIEGRFHYKYEGDWEGKADNRHIIVGAVLRGESEIQWGEPLYPAKVTTKNSPLWKTNEKQQSAYLGVKYWTRLYCPAVLLGVYTADEVEDFDNGPRDVTPKTMNLEDLGGNNVESGDVVKSEALTEVLSLIAAATDKYLLAAAAQKAKLLSAVERDAATPPYREKLSQLKAQEEAVIDQEPEAVVAGTETEPEHSKEFVGIEKLIDMANTEADLEAIINLPLWEELSKGEAPRLQEFIAIARESFAATTATAEGSFGS